MRDAKTAYDLRMAQTVLIPGILNVPDSLTGQIVGRSGGTVVRMRRKFLNHCSGEKPQRGNWGGRRYDYLTIEQVGNEW